MAANLMSTHKCCYCYDVVSRVDPDIIAISLHEDTSLMIVRWCKPCFEKDPHGYAFAIGGDGPEANLQLVQALHAVCDRAFAAKGREGLVRCIDVRKDLSSILKTLRGPGPLWGRQSARKRAS